MKDMYDETELTVESASNDVRISMSSISDYMLDNNAFAYLTTKKARKLARKLNKEADKADMYEGGSIFATRS